MSQHYIDNTYCPYRVDDKGQHGVICPKRQRICGKCGFYPPIEAERIEAIRAKYSKQG